MNIAVPTVDDPIQAGWSHLVADLVADITGSGTDGYPTFRDGYLANQLIDQVRAAAAAAENPIDWRAAEQVARTVRDGAR